MPVMMLLGGWQLERADEKSEILSKQHKLIQLPAAPLSTLKPEELVRYRQVKMNGFYMNDHSFLLDNSVRNGKVGYEVLTPFLDHNSDAVVLVNRGWIKAPAYRSELPKIPTVNGERLIIGTIYRPYMTRTTNASELWPKVIQAVEIDVLADTLNQKFVNYTVRIDSASAGALEAGWMVVNVQPEKHTAYAVQWFAMSLALLLLIVYTNFIRLQENK